MCDTKDEKIIQATQYLEEANCRLSGVVKMLQLTDNQVAAITEVIVQLMTEHELASFEMDNLVSEITPVIGYTNDMKTLGNGGNPIIEKPPTF